MPTANHSSVIREKLIKAGPLLLPDELMAHWDESFDLYAAIEDVARQFDVASQVTGQTNREHFRTLCSLERQTINILARAWGPNLPIDVCAEFAQIQRLLGSNDVGNFLLVWHRVVQQIAKERPQLVRADWQNILDAKPAYEKDSAWLTIYGRMCGQICRAFAQLCRERGVVGGIDTKSLALNAKMNHEPFYPPDTLEKLTRFLNSLAFWMFDEKTGWRPKDAERFNTEAREFALKIKQNIPASPPIPVRTGNAVTDLGNIREWAVNAMSATLVMNEQSTQNQQMNHTSESLNAALSPRDLAKKFDLSLESVKHALSRWRTNNAGGDGYIENPDARQNDPKFLYKLGYVTSVLNGLVARKVKREGRTKTSRERPAGK